MEESSPKSGARVVIAILVLVVVLLLSFIAYLFLGGTNDAVGAVTGASGTAVAVQSKNGENPVLVVNLSVPVGHEDGILQFNERKQSVTLDPSVALYFGLTTVTVDTFASAVKEGTPLYLSGEITGSGATTKITAIALVDEQYTRDSYKSQ